MSSDVLKLDVDVSPVVTGVVSVDEAVASALVVKCNIAGIVVVVEVKDLWLFQG